MALGRKLVDELGLEPSVDTLGRWMAHYIAELMDAAANAPPEECAASRKRCFDAILELWSHQAELPDGRRPFQDLEPIMRAMESLDPENEEPRYFRTVRNAIFEGDEDRRTQSLMEFVCDLDTTARILIAYTLVDAACSAIDKSRAWIALAEEAGANPGVFGLTVGFVSDDWESDPNTGRNKRDRLRGRIDRLERFVDMVGQVVEDLKKRRDTVERQASDSAHPHGGEGPSGAQ